MFFKCAILVAFLFIAAQSAPLEDDVISATPFADVENYRLPEIIRPINYTISLQPYLHEDDGAKRFTFDGEVHIRINTTVTANQIILHTKNLNYSLRELWTETNPTIKTTLGTYEVNNVTDKITYNLTTNLAVGTVYVLHFVYNGTMDDDMHGFYRSSYTDKKNVTKWLGSTQFETYYARRAFPAFDEPSFKATFDVSITHHKSLKAVSNTRVLSSQLTGNLTVTVFEKTPIMSTYLLAFIVSEFNERWNGDFGVLARPEYYDQTEYSFNVGQELLQVFDDYLALPYYQLGVDKMHLVAVPDFSAGAMENWGLVTFRERSVLYDNSHSTLSSKQAIAAVISHEQAHMWFGDLVTCSWWSYTWLNEGFARYFQYFATAEVETGLGLDQQFVVDQIQSVMSMDSTNSTNPMSDENTNSPADLSRMFNSISYNKGASIIRMVKHVMGEENFQNSLREYLNTNKYKAAVPKNLFDVWKAHWPSQWLDYADGVFSNFTEQVGYPLISVNVSDDKRSFQISQSRFLLKDINDGSNASLLYTVPITYTTDVEKNFSSTTPKLFLNATTNAQTVQLSTNISWIILNIQETGYYRVNYSEHYWHQLHHALLSTNWSGIHELNRAQIVDDLLNLARAGVVTYNLTLDVLEYLETETNYLPWTAAFNGYSYLSIRLGVDTEDFSVYIRALTRKAYNLLGFEERVNDTALEIYTRTKVLAWNCKYGNPDCISKARSYFNNINNTAVPVNIRSVVYCTALREGGESEFNTLFNKYKTETVPTEETLILNNLGCVRDTNLVDKFFFIILSDAVRRQDKSSALTTLYTENNENVTPVFELVTENYLQLADALGSLSSVASVISNIASRFTEESQKESLEKFNAAHKTEFGASSATLEAAVRTVDENLAWAGRKMGIFKEYLNIRRGSGSATTSAFTALTLVLVALVAMLFH